MTTRCVRTRLACVTTGVLLGMASSTTAAALPSCLSRASITSDGVARVFPAPLNRAVSIKERDVPLRDALDRVAAASHVRLTYSADLLPRDRRVCLNLDRVPAGAVLSELLRGTGLRPLAIDGDNVVLTPARPALVSEPLPERLNTISQLDRIVVTGTAAPGTNRSTPFGMEVIDRASLLRQDVSSLATALDGAVPGVWMWSQSPSSTTGRFGSVRGASSFGVTSPKIYIDGIEVANPLVLTQFDPERVDHVEVIRGPQGAALYGAEAISGVVNIVMRHDGLRADESTRVLRTRAGFTSSALGTNGAFVQDHSIGLRGGSDRRSFGLGASVGTVGNYIPNGGARSLLGNGDVKLVGARAVFTGITRFAAKDAGTSIYGIDSSQSVRHYTIGTTTTFMPGARWTHTLVAGVDGYRLNGVSTDGLSVSASRDPLAPRPHSESDRTTVSARSVARFGNEDAHLTTLTFGAEHAATRQQLESHNLLQGGELSLSANSRAQTTSMWSNTAGLLAQVNESFANSVFLSAGGRVERTSGYASLPQVSFLPMLGAVYAHDRDGQSLKLRASYGKGIRPSNSALRAATWMSGQTPSVGGGLGSELLLRSLRNLEPESQSGVEFGADVTFSQFLTVHVTHFNQRATGLIQAVAIPIPVRMGMPNAQGGLIHELQNVGAISNRGWEFQAGSMVGALSLQAAVSVVDSRIDRVATLYGGDLRTGDRMLEVPARTFSLQAAYSSLRWSTVWTVARATDWMNYDQLRLTEQRKVPNFDMKSVTGLALRDYWKHYDGATRLRGSFSYSVTPGLALMMSGDNLLNLQRGEPDNITVIPGRTLTFGIRTRF